MKLNLFFLSGLLACTAATGQNIEKLSSMDLGLIYQQYGSAQKGKSTNAKEIQLNNQVCENAIGLHAPAVAKLNLNGNASRFTTKLRIESSAYPLEDLVKIPLTDGTMMLYLQNNDTKEFAGVCGKNGTVDKGSAIIRIIGDGKVLYESKALTASNGVVEVDIPVQGVQVLELIADEGKDGPSGDYVTLIDPVINYNEIKPVLVPSDFNVAIAELPQAKGLMKKASSLPKVSLPIEQTSYDWLLNSDHAKANVYSANNGKDIVLSNGLISRVFRITPNLATIDLLNHMDNQSLIRAVSNEGVLKIDGKVYPLGGLKGQKEYGYTRYNWVDDMTVDPQSFRVVDFKVQDFVPQMKWKNTRWALEKQAKTTGKELIFTLQGPNELSGIKVNLHYVLYDGLPCINKWFEVINTTPLSVNLDEFKLEQLAMAEPESPVELKNPDHFRKPNIHVESDWAFLGFIEKSAERTEYWEKDPRYTSQCNYPLITPCLLEVKLPMGPDVKIEPQGRFESFKNWIMPFDSDDRERKGLFVRRMQRKIAPWVTQNPIFMHCTSSDDKVVKEAIDQCAEVGYEMVILSFGSGLNMEDESDANIRKFKALVDYAKSKGIELGGYSLLSSRWIIDDVDVINPETGKRGGMIFGSSPCLCSDWGVDYFRKVKTFFEKTGMTVFENDGSYPGNVCASTTHTHHNGLYDSQWKQRQRIVELYQWMCENGIYTNIPDYGYMLNGGTKVGIGYREVNWSLPRERQLVLGRQVMYDGLWERMPGMCWTFVPLVQYHGGGAEATLEPLKDHLVDYKAHMMQNYGTGVQACYRGFRLYDSPETKATVKEVVDWYKKYRNILNSEVIHLRRPDGNDWDGIMHVNPTLNEKAMIMLYNPTDEPISRAIRIPLYYTGLTQNASLTLHDGTKKKLSLDREYNATCQFEIPARGYVWAVIE
ncbi:MAG: NPCBM/NEW2 domain-containing protein [Tannerellaceae bacterium]